MRPLPEKDSPAHPASLTDGVRTVEPWGEDLQEEFLDIAPADWLWSSLFYQGL